MNTLYMVTWTGGYETPEYEFFTDKDQAFAKALDWYADAEMGVDTIDLVEINLATLDSTRIEGKDLL